jgi:hypothetical protein
MLAARRLEVKKPRRSDREREAVEIFDGLLATLHRNSPDTIRAVARRLGRLGYTIRPVSDVSYTMVDIGARSIS